MLVSFSFQVSSRHSTANKEDHEGMAKRVVEKAGGKVRPIINSLQAAIEKISKQSPPPTEVRVSARLSSVISAAEELQKGQVCLFSFSSLLFPSPSLSPSFLLLFLLLLTPPFLQLDSNLVTG